MLSQADLALVHRDTALPGLAAMLDPAGLVRRAAMGDLRPIYLRYKPGTSCVIGLVPPGGGLGAVAAMTYPPERYAEVRARTKWQTGPEPVRYLDDICTALVPLRHDRQVKAVRRLCSVEQRLDYLHHLGLDDAELKLLRYKPGRRLVLRADLPSGDSAILKAHARIGFAAAVAGARHADRLASLDLISIDEEQSVIAARWIAGSALDPARSGADAFYASGEELARLHKTAPCPNAVPKATDPRPAASAAAILLPRISAAMAKAALSISEELQLLKAAPCMIHGDFSADQVVTQEGGAIVIDWDRMAIGDPARDLGSFQARLDLDVIRGIVSQQTADAAAEALLRGYAGPRGRIPEGLATHRAAALLALTTEGFRDRRPDWAQEIETIVSRVGTLLPHKAVKPMAMTPGLSEALDTSAMAIKLAAIFEMPAGTALQARLLRHKPGRRALIRYELVGLPPVLGKLRAKGPDHRTPALHKALRAAGLDGRSVNLVGVPDLIAEMETPPMWLQQVVPGHPLTELLTTESAAKVAGRTGEALALLHTTKIPIDREWTLDDELDVIDRSLDHAVATRPDLRNSVETVRRSAHAVLRSLPSVESAGIHRDFYPDQVLIDGEAVWLVDLDLYATGDPLLDIGNFQAHLTELGLRDHADPRRFAPEMAAFVDGYEARVGRTDHDRLRTLHWASLIRHIGIGQRVPGRAHTIGSLVEICAGGPDDPAFSILTLNAQPAA